MLKTCFELKHKKNWGILDNIYRILVYLNYIISQTTLILKTKEHNWFFLMHDLI